MSARAIARLREMWQNLEFFHVDQTTAREPDDIFFIQLRIPSGQYRPDGEPIYSGFEPSTTHHKTLAEVPQEDRQRARVVWRRFSGTTTSGLEFDSTSYHELDLTADMTLDYSTWSNHRSRGDRPAPGQLICGERASGHQLRRWFTCDDAFRRLVTYLREGLRPTDDELGRLLLTDGFPDTLWAIARLVFLDNVQPFVDQIRIGSGPPEPRRHPAYGCPYGPHGYTVHWQGMQLPIGSADFVHELSRTLGEPAWWEEFLRLCGEQGVTHHHPGPGRICHACTTGPDCDENGVPNQIGGPVS